MKTSRWVLYAAAAGMMLADASAMAQSASQSTSLDEIVVTATKREEKLKDVAMSITAISGEELLRRNDRGFADFAAQIPGLSLQPADVGSTRVILRGQNVGSVGATIATTIDDIPFFMSGAQSNGAVFSADLDTFDLKRVEVLRGPQGTLYGAAAEGGLIKYVTNPPDPSKFAAQLVGGINTISDGDTGAYGKIMLNMPLLNGKAALRLNVTNDAVAGWIDNTYLNQKDLNRGTKKSFRGSFLINPTDELMVRLTAFNQKVTGRADNTVNVVGAALTPTAPPANKLDPVNGQTLAAQLSRVVNKQMEYYALSASYQFPAATLYSSTSYGEITNHYSYGLQNENVAPGVTYSNLLVDIFGVYSEPILLRIDQTDFVKKFNQELRLSSNAGNTLFGHGFDWQLGGFFTRETTALIQPVDILSAANPGTVLSPPGGGANIPAYYKEKAFFADATFHFSPAFDIEAGARHTKTEQHSQVNLFCCVLFGPDFTFPAIYSDENSNTWSIAPRWHVTDNTLLYARVSTGFRPGGPNLPTATLPNPPGFRSDKTRNYEAGVRTSLLDNRLKIDLAVFDIDWKDVQILGLVQTPTGPIGINGNSGSAKSKGIEWNFDWRPLDNLSLSFLGAYTDAKLTTDAPGLGGFNGDKLPYVPDVSATFNVDYTWHAFGAFNGFAGGSVTHVGKQYTDFSPSVTVVESHVKLPSYNTVKLQLGLEDGQYSAEVFVNNLTNKHAILTYSSEGGFNQTGLARVLQPRTIGIQLGAKF
jgi:iron complex outermembrane recepter protein